MKIKAIYNKNKAIIVNLLTICIFAILIVPVYFAYSYFSDYEKNINKQIKEKNVEMQNVIAQKNSRANMFNTKEQELSSFNENKKTVLEDYKKIELLTKNEMLAKMNDFIVDITAGLELLNLRFVDGQVVGQKVMQLPHDIEVKSSYSEMIELINQIMDEEDIKVNQISINLAGDLIDTKISAVALAKQEQIEEIKSEDNKPVEVDLDNLISRVNPFGKPTTYDEYKKIIDEAIENSQDLNSSNDLGTIFKISKYEPMKIDLELVADYNNERNIINDVYTKNSHDISLRAPEGTKVYSVDFGKVIYVGEFGMHGNSVMIEHKNNVITYYGNLRNIKVIKGEKVTKGRLIAETAGMGDEREAHLKFAVAIMNKFVDPKNYLDLKIERNLSQEVKEDDTDKKNEEESEVSSDEKEN